MHTTPSAATARIIRDHGRRGLSGETTNRVQMTRTASANTASTSVTKTNTANDSRAWLMSAGPPSVRDEAPLRRRAEGDGAFRAVEPHREPKARADVDLNGEAQCGAQRTQSARIGSGDLEARQCA